MSLALLFIAAVLFVITAVLYPTTTELPTPLYAQVGVTSPRPIGLVQYSVYQVSPATAEIEFRIELPPNATVPAAGTSGVHLLVFPPIGISFTTCPHPACEFEPAASISSWKVLLDFKTISGPNGPTGTAFANFFVRAPSYGDTYNSVNAAAAIPEVYYSGPGTPAFQTQYNIPHASSYDWSGFPVQFANATFATWTQQVTGGVLPGRDAIGVDYANQSRDGYFTFLAGAILGLAGGAVISALQEALTAG